MFEAFYIGDSHGLFLQKMGPIFRKLNELFLDAQRIGRAESLAKLKILQQVLDPVFVCVGKKPVETLCTTVKMLETL